MAKSSNILIFGKGYIGEKLQKHLNCDLTEAQISCYQDVQREIDRYKPKVIINCIGYTGYPNVDECEDKIDTTIQANVMIPILFAEAVVRNNIRLVHISSGCIYNFDFALDKPIVETKEPDFIGLFYSRTKIYAEKALSIKGLEKKILTLRIRIPLDNVPNPKNLLDKLIKYGKAIDIPNSITYVPDLMKVASHLIKIKAFGIYNVVNKGGLRYPALMRIYQKYQPDFKFETVKLKQVLKTPRTNVVQSTRKLEKSGFKVRKVEDILEECVKEYAGVTKEKDQEQINLISNYSN